VSTLYCASVALELTTDNDRQQTIRLCTRETALTSRTYLVENDARRPHVHLGGNSEHDTTLVNKKEHKLIDKQKEANEYTTSVDVHTHSRSTGSSVTSETSTCACTLQRRRKSTRSFTPSHEPSTTCCVPGGVALDEALGRQVPVGACPLRGQLHTRALAGLVDDLRQPEV
jgi:hypothetical protein